MVRPEPDTLPLPVETLGEVELVERWSWSSWWSWCVLPVAVGVATVELSCDAAAAEGAGG